MKIALLGCGNMGMAYAQSFMKHHIVTKENFLLIEKNEARREELVKLDMGKVIGELNEELNQCDIIILAVKPQDFQALGKELKNLLNPETIILSIMAGLTTARIADTLGATLIVRAMPNSPAQIGMGITAYTATAAIEVDQLHKVEKLLAATGRTVFIEKEEYLNAVTALSGSGPAYFFYFVKSMVKAGTQMGLEESVAAMLVEQTMFGSFHLINNATQSLDELITAVASKGGTTEAALDKLREKQVGENLIEAILNAEKRAKELSKLL